MIDDLVKRLRYGDEFEKVMSGGQAADRIEKLEDKLASVIAAYRIEAMRREDYSHEAFDQHIAELKGEDRG